MSRPTYGERVERAAAAILAALWTQPDRQHIYSNDARDAIRQADELVQQCVAQFKDDVPLADDPGNFRRKLAAAAERHDQIVEKAREWAEWDADETLEFVQAIADGDEL